MKVKGSKSPASNSALFRTFASKTADTLPLVKFMPEVTFVSVTKAGQQEINVFTILRNRMHSNVAFMLGESLRYQEELDTLTVLDEVVGSYPNLMLSVAEQEISNMVDAMMKVKNKKDFDQFIDIYGVRRMQARFWLELHSYHSFLDKTSPLESGYLDINRYGYW